MISVIVKCPYCMAAQHISAPDDHNLFYVNCPCCSSRFVAEPMDGLMRIYRHREAPLLPRADFRQTGRCVGASTARTDRDDRPGADAPLPRMDDVHRIGTK